VTDRAQLRRQFSAALADVIADFGSAYKADVIACLKEALLPLECDLEDEIRHERDHAYGKQLSMKSVSR